MYRVRNEQFTTLVRTALAETMQDVEKDAVARFTYELIREDERHRTRNHMLGQSEEDSLLYDPLAKLHQWNMLLQSSQFARCPRDQVYDTLLNNSVLVGYPDEMQQRLVNAFFYYSERLTDVVLHSIISLDNDVRPLENRIDFNVLEFKLNEALRGVDINEPYVYRVYDHTGKIFGTNDPKHNQLHHSDENTGDKNGSGAHYRQEQTVRRNLFEGLLLNQRYAGYIEVCFPNHQGFVDPNLYATFSVSLMLLFLILTAVAMLLFSRQIAFSKNRKNFVNNLTHELKTPLTSIMLASDMLENSIGTDEEKTPKQERIFNVLKSETKRLSFIVEKVLQFTLVDEGKVRFYPIAVNVQEILEDIYTVYDIKCRQLGGAVTLSMDLDHPVIKVDKLHFQNIVFNLMDNAVKYRKESEPIQIDVRCYAKEPQSVTVSITDNGIGIGRSDQKRIFNQYYRVETGNVHNVKGFGLGLSYVQRTVTAMGGKIEVESRKGVGTTMRITFPAYTEADKPNKEANEQ